MVIGVPKEIKALENRVAGAMTSTFVLTNAILSYAVKLDNLGYKEALGQDRALMKGLNINLGKLVCSPVAEAQGLECSLIEL
jgi:alanine dehydrogenase